MAGAKRRPESLQAGTVFSATAWSDVVRMMRLIQRGWEIAVAE
jgi:hypothetical protein